LPFQPGNKYSKGRQPGSKNIRARELEEACQEADRRGYPHPYLQMAEWANDETKPLEFRGSMVKECAAYRCPKPKETRSIQFDIQQLTSVEQAEASIVAIATENDLDPVELITAIRHWIDSKRAGQELELKQIAAGGAREQTIRIIGGPYDINPDGNLPGSNVIMPHLNGHAHEELPAPAPQLASPKVPEP
jgi:hypothetical protein